MFQVSENCHMAQIERCGLYSGYSRTYPHVQKHHQRPVRDISSSFLQTSPSHFGFSSLFFWQLFAPLFLLRCQPQSLLLYFFFISWIHFSTWFMVEYILSRTRINSRLIYPDLCSIKVKPGGNFHLDDINGSRRNIGLTYILESETALFGNPSQHIQKLISFSEYRWH